MANDGRNALVAVRSDPGDPEGGPAGYAIRSISAATTLAVRYRSVEESGPVVVVTHPRERLLATGPRHIVSGPDRVVVRVWSAARVWAVRARIDEGAWASLNSSEDGNWSGPLPGMTGSPRGSTSWRSWRSHPTTPRDLSGSASW